jgi:hypothetical protein
MGKKSRESNRALKSETREPKQPRNWPYGHVAVDLTGSDSEECFLVTVHGVDHYLHSTTTRELSNMLLDRLDQWNATALASGIEPV